MENGSCPDCFEVQECHCVKSYRISLFEKQLDSLATFLKEALDKTEVSLVEDFLDDGKLRQALRKNAEIFRIAVALAKQSRLN